MRDVATDNCSVLHMFENTSFTIRQHIGTKSELMVHVLTP